jgi:hypothetical protein
MTTINKTILLLISILILTCSGKKTNSIDGLWYHCGYTGDYEEILFTDSIAISLIVFQEDLLKGEPIDLDMTSRLLGPFRYYDDSIRICLGNELYEENSPDLIKQHVEFITPNQIELSPKYDNRLEKVIFNRIHKYPKPPENMKSKNDKWWSDFKANFEERLNSIQCPDLRSKDERIKDSIEELNNKVILSTQSEDFEDLLEIDSKLDSQNNNIK